MHDDRYAFLLSLDGENTDSKVDLGSINIYLISDFVRLGQSYEDVLSFNNDLFGMKQSRGYIMEEV